MEDKNTVPQDCKGNKLWNQWQDNSETPMHFLWEAVDLNT
jgi:hypothetical protein